MNDRGCYVSGCDSHYHAKGYCKIHFLRWNRHGDPLKRLRNANGEGSISKQGYFLKTVNGKQKLAHVHIAEEILGRELKNGELVHHSDENKLNNSKTNLVVCANNAYHQLLHKRIRALNACGNANWRRCGYCKKYDDPKNLYIHKGNCFHRECQNAYKRDQLRKKNDN